MAEQNLTTDGGPLKPLEAHYPTRQLGFIPDLNQTLWLFTKPLSLSTAYSAGMALFHAGEGLHFGTMSPVEGGWSPLENPNVPPHFDPGRCRSHENIGTMGTNKDIYMALSRMFLCSTSEDPLRAQ